MPEPTHYQVLGLSQSALSSTKTPSPILKKAYRRALLQNHPDKATRLEAAAAAAAATAEARSVQFTVDQITTAFLVLSSPSKRSEYDISLQLSQERGGPDGGVVRGGDFQTGVEELDLDELELDQHEACWYRSCRCGNPRGFSFVEADLEHVLEDGELIVGCVDCSLWLKVHFAVLEDENENHGAGS